jgi:hypothetical protein
MYRLALVVCLILSLWLTTLCLADIPKLINYQGMLTDDAGYPLTDTVSINFKIYNAPSGGDKRWEETQTDVAVTEGLFNVILGGATVGGIDIDFAEEYWLEVTVEGEQTGERLRFTSVAYAYRALVADSAAVAGSGTGGAGGWVDDGSVVRLETITDKVGIGTGSPDDKVEVVDGSMNARLAYYHYFSFPAPHEIWSGVRGTYGGDVEGFLGRRYWSSSTGNTYYGVYGSATTSGKNYGVYGSASGGSTNWAGYFDGDVHATGDISLNAGGDIAFADNSTRIYEASDDLLITADDDLKLEPDDHIYIRKDGGSYWAIFDNVNERLGVGTTSPSEKLDVEGNIDVSNNQIKNYYGFPKPNYNSGWLTINQDQTLTITHNIGGNVDNYVVDLQFKDLDHGWGTNSVKMGGDSWVSGHGGEWDGFYYYVYSHYGACWGNLTSTSIKVKRLANDVYADKILVRIWVIQ